MIDNEKNVAFWNGAAKTTREDSKSFAGMGMDGRRFEAIYRSESEQKHFLKIIAPEKHHRVLEIGSGGGRWALFLADKVQSYVGLDISEKMVAIATEECERRKIANAQFQCVDFLDYVSNETFDLVYFSGVLQYMDDEVVEKCVAKASGFLSPEGVVLSRDSVRIVGRTEKTGDYPVIYRTGAEYKAIFEAGGFNMAYSGISYPHKRFSKIASRIYNLSGGSYRTACILRDALCMADDCLGSPGFLKTQKHKIELSEKNPLEHRFYKYVRK